MNNALMFSKAKDEWRTPPEFFAELDDEFNLTLDAAAMKANRQTALYLGPDHSNPECRDALRTHWRTYKGGAAWCNPPYSQCRQFVAKAKQEAALGTTVVMLIPSRTDTRFWHESIWDRDLHRPLPGVELRFIKGRLKFGNSTNSAPFPSVVIVFRPVLR